MKILHSRYSSFSTIKHSCYLQYSREMYFAGQNRLEFVIPIWDILLSPLVITLSLYKKSSHYVFHRMKSNQWGATIPSPNLGKILTFYQKAIKVLPWSHQIEAKNFDSSYSFDFNNRCQLVVIKAYLVVKIWIYLMFIITMQSPITCAIITDKSIMKN